MRLRLLVLEIADRCDQRCVHCDIWRAGPRTAALDRAERLRLVDEALAAGVREVLLTGGEPLLSPDLWPLASRLREARARVMVATTGLGLAAHADAVAGLCDEVYVSLDGPDAVHDDARGEGAFARLAAGVIAVRQRSPRPRLVARSVVHARNIDRLVETIAAARRLGVDHLSFLPVDVHSDAFGGRPQGRRPLVPSAEQVAGFERAVDDLAAEGGFADGFVLENAAKLRRVARHLQASAGRADFERPRCDAPRWSSVVTMDGRLRPCFFHPAVDDVRGGLLAVRASAAYRHAVARTEAPNAACERCVCAKWRGSAWRRLLRL